MNRECSPGGAAPGLHSRAFLLQDLSRNDEFAKLRTVPKETSPCMSPSSLLYSLQVLQEAPFSPLVSLQPPSPLKPIVPHRNEALPMNNSDHLTPSCSLSRQILLPLATHCNKIPLHPLPRPPHSPLHSRSTTAASWLFPTPPSLSSP